MPVVLKIKCEDQCFRAKLEKDDPKQVSYESVHGEIRQALPQLQNYIARYNDDKSNSCTLSPASFPEFISSVEEHAEQSVLKLEIVPLEAEESEDRNGSPEVEVLNESELGSGLQQQNTPLKELQHQAHPMRRPKMRRPRARYVVIGYPSCFGKTPCILEAHDELEKAQGRFYDTGIFTALVYDTQKKCIPMGTHTAVAAWFWFHNTYHGKPLAYSGGKGPALASDPSIPAATDKEAINATIRIFAEIPQDDPLRPLLEYAMVKYGAPSDELTRHLSISVPAHCAARADHDSGIKRPDESSPSNPFLIVSHTAASKRQRANGLEFAR